VERDNEGRITSTPLTLALSPETGGEGRKIVVNSLAPLGGERAQRAGEGGTNEEGKQTEAGSGAQSRFPKQYSALWLRM
jgi:hypothetical protein